MKTEARGTAVVMLTYHTGEEEERTYKHLTYNDSMKEASRIVLRDHKHEIASIDVDFCPMSHAADVLHPA